MAEKLVTAARFDMPETAHIAKIQLESEGIQCFIENEYFGGMHWLVSAATSRIKLKVRSCDLQKAIEILSGNTTDTEGEVFADDAKCPKCGSDNIGYERFSRKVFFFSLLLLRFPLPFIKKKFKCQDCGHMWK